MRKNLTRAAVTASATALTFGLAAPAATAHDRGDRGDRHGYHHGWDRGEKESRWDRGERGYSFEEKQQRVLNGIDAALAWLDRKEQRVAASDEYSEQERAAKLERIQAARAALTDLREQVAAATSSEELRTAVREFRDSYGYGFS